MSDTYPSDKAEKIVVRLPDGMRDQLATVAKANGRSVNAEVVARLEQTLQLASGGPLFDTDQIVKEAVNQALDVFRDQILASFNSDDEAPLRSAADIEKIKVRGRRAIVKARQAK